LSNAALGWVCGFDGGSRGGIAAASVAVLFFSDFKIDKANAGFVLLCLASLCRAGMALAMKGGAMAGAGVAPTLCIAGCVWCVSGLCWDRQLLPDRRTLLYGIGSGILTIGVALFLYLALSLGNGAVIIPISQLSFAVTALLAWAIFKEGLNRRQGLAIACSIVAVVCLGVFG
jgi:uncharacterized membrane protein